jgi:hypothetical protein
MQFAFQLCIMPIFEAALIKNGKSSLPVEKIFQRPHPLNMALRLNPSRCARQSWLMTGTITDGITSVVIFHKGRFY